MKPIDAEAILELTRQSTEQVALLSRVGEVLYGDRWQTQLAQALGVSDRQLGRWVSVEADTPSWMKSYHLCSRRSNALRLGPVTRRQRSRTTAAGKRTVPVDVR